MHVQQFVLLGSGHCCIGLRCGKEGRGGRRGILEEVTARLNDMFAKEPKSNIAEVFKQHLALGEQLLSRDSTKMIRKNPKKHSEAP